MTETTIRPARPGDPAKAAARPSSQRATGAPQGVTLTMTEVTQMLRAADKALHGAHEVMQVIAVHYRDDPEVRRVVQHAQQVTQQRDELVQRGQAGQPVEAQEVKDLARDAERVKDEVEATFGERLRKVEHDQSQLAGRVDDHEKRIASLASFMEANDDGVPKVVAAVNAHAKTLHGEDGKSGLVRDVADLKARMVGEDGKSSFVTHQELNERLEQVTVTEYEAGSGPSLGKVFLPAAVVALLTFLVTLILGRGFIFSLIVGILLGGATLFVSGSLAGRSRRSKSTHTSRTSDESTTH